MNVPKILTVFTIITITLASIWSIFDYFNSFQYLTIKSPNKPLEGEVIVQPGIHGDGGLTPTRDSEPIVAAVNEPIKLKKGLYVVSYTSKKYKNYTVGAGLGDTPYVIEIAQTYKEETLAKELPYELPAIKNTLKKKYPEIFNKYDIIYGKLYEQSDWYGAVLRWKGDKGARNRDTIRIVLQKKDDVWRIVADPYPSISQMEYPQIPKQLLGDINKLYPSIEELDQPKGSTD